MRMLGHKASVSVFRWDIIYLVAQLTADTRPGVSVLADPLQALRTKLHDERDAFEQAEDAVVVAAALRHRKDRHRDALLVEMGGVTRASDKDVYGTLFPKLNPSATARLGIDAESAEIRRILGELAKLAADHPARSAYEMELTEAEAAMKSAGAQTDQAVTTLALQRSQLDRFKLEMDQARLEAHGKLVALLKSKPEAEAFFRPTTSSPSEEPAAEGAPTDSPAPTPPVS